MSKITHIHSSHQKTHNGIIWHFQSHESATGYVHYSLPLSRYPAVAVMISRSSEICSWFYDRLRDLRNQDLHFWFVFSQPRHLSIIRTGTEFDKDHFRTEY